MCLKRGQEWQEYRNGRNGPGPEMVGFDIDNRFYSSSASSNLFEKKRSLSKRLRKSATTSGGVLAGRTIAGACSRFFLVSSFCPHRKKKIPELSRHCCPHPFHLVGDLL